MASLKKYRHGLMIVLATMLSALAMVAMTMAAPQLESIHLSYNLSNTTGAISANPSLALSPDNEWMAVTWIEEYSSGAGNKGDVLLRATSDPDSGWGSRITVFDGGSDACAYGHPSVEIEGSTAHLAYVVFEPCQSPTGMSVYYQTCPLSGAPCSNPQSVTWVDTDSNTILEVDLALDDNADPHVVWARYNQDGENGKIRYRAQDGNYWGSEETVSMGGENDFPAITWAGNYVHVVWTSSTSVQYRRRDTDWDTLRTLYSALNYPPGSPDVAAAGERVFVVWDRCINYYYDENNPCAKHGLVYRRSNDKGESWMPNPFYGVGTDDSLWPFEEYDSTDVGDYLSSLQPALALNRDGWPIVAWHAQREGGEIESWPLRPSAGGDYKIYYSYALSGTNDHVDWVITPTILNQTQVGMGSAVAGMGRRENGEYLHAVYMRKVSGGGAWDVYYEGFSFYPYAVIRSPGMVVVSNTTTLVTLDGSGSYDPRGISLEEYAWSLTDRPAGSTATLSSLSAVSPTISLDKLGGYTVTLQVSTTQATSSLETRAIWAYENVYHVYLPLVMREK